MALEVCDILSSNECAELVSGKLLESRRIAVCAGEQVRQETTASTDFTDYSDFLLIVTLKSKDSNGQKAGARSLRMI